MKQTFKYFLIVGLVVLLSGCTSVNFSKAPDGTVSVSYSRFLTNVDRVEGQVGDSKVSVGGSTVNVESLTQLLQAMPR